MSGGGNFEKTYTPNKYRRDANILLKQILEKCVLGL
jgi:hypothetical protein